MSLMIRQRAQGHRRRGSLDTLVRTRPGLAIERILSPNNVSILRYMEIVGPQAPAIGGFVYETKAWTAATIPPQSYTSGESPWFIEKDVGEPAHYIEPSNGREHWVYNTHPMRFRISSWASRWWRQITDKLRSTNYFGTPGYSSKLPAAASHVGPMSVTSCSVPMGLFQYVIPFGSAGGTSVSITHYRLWVDGTDVSGIVSISQGVSFGNGVVKRGSGSFQLPLAGTYDEATIEIDLWLSMDTTVLDPANPRTLAIVEATLNGNMQTMAFEFADTNKKRRASDKYRLDFLNDGIGGLSSLTLETGSGWTSTNQGAAVSVSKAGTGSVNFDWSLECPIILYNDVSKNNSPSGTLGVVKYYPVDSGHYDGAVLSSGATLTPGVWNARGSTAFFPAGRLLSTNGQYALSGDAAITGAFTGMFDGFPDSITVVKV
jgi:hypothetical protein